MIPGNDDALRAIRLFASRIADAVIGGRDMKQSSDAEQAREATNDSSPSGEDFRRGRQVRRSREAAPASA